MQDDEALVIVDDAVPRRWGRTAGLLGIFGALSLIAVGLGAIVAASHGVATGSWSRNLIAWIIGAVFAVAIGRGLRSSFLQVALWTAPVGLLATLVSPDQEGVHRWIDLGPLHINVATLLLPAALVASAALIQTARWPVAVLIGCLAILVVQPDASQATALGVGVAALLVGRGQKASFRMGALVICAILTAMAWLRPDPLQPVAEVEDILNLAWALSPILAVAGVVLIAGVAAAPMALTRFADPASRLAGTGLTVLLIVWAVAPFLGAYPVPFVGIGMSAILGGWLGMGVLAALIRSNASGGSPEAKPRKGKT